MCARESLQTHLAGFVDFLLLCLWGALSHSLCMLSARGELYRRKILFLDDFPIFFIRMSPGPTHPLEHFFEFFNFANPRRERESFLFFFRVTVYEPYVVDVVVFSRKHFAMTF